MKIFYLVSLLFLSPTIALANKPIINNVLACKAGTGGPSWSHWAIIFRHSDKVENTNLYKGPLPGEEGALAMAYASDIKEYIDDYKTVITIPKEWEGLSNFDKKYDDLVDSSIGLNRDAYFGARGYGFGMYLGPNEYGIGKTVFHLGPEYARVLYVVECTEKLRTLNFWLRDLDKVK